MSPGTTDAQILTLTGGTNALGATANLIDVSSTTTGTIGVGVTDGVGTTTVTMEDDGAINVGGSATINFGANSIIFGAVNLAKTGSGTLVLAGANTFGGGGFSFTLNSGTLAINNASALGDGDTTVVINGGRIDNTTAAPITTSNYVQTWGGDFTFGGSQALNLAEPERSRSRPTAPSP